MIRVLAICFSVLFVLGCPSRNAPAPAKTAQPSASSAQPDPLVAQAKIANAIAVTVNEAIPLLRDFESQEGDEVIHSSTSEASARLGLAEVEKRWKPVWEALKVLRVAQDAWATALEKGGDRDAALGAVLSAFCKLSPLLPRQMPRLSLAIYLCEVNGGTR